MAAIAWWPRACCIPAFSSLLEGSGQGSGFLMKSVQSKQLLWGMGGQCAPLRLSLGSRGEEIACDKTLYKNITQEAQGWGERDPCHSHHTANSKDLGTLMTCCTPLHFSWGRFRSLTLAARETLEGLSRHEGKGGDISKSSCKTILTVLLMRFL